MIQTAPHRTQKAALLCPTAPSNIFVLLLISRPTKVLQRPEDLRFAPGQVIKDEPVLVS